MNHFLEVSNHALFYYYLVCNLAYLAMLIIALRASAVHQRRLKSSHLEWIKGSPMVPPITILAPALNEEKSISVAVRSLLDLDYPELEIIIINDGSSDKTLELLQQEFRLWPVRALYIPYAACARVRELYRSAVDPRLWSSTRSQGGVRQMR